jgi:hypothetical protein
LDNSASGNIATVAGGQNNVASVGNQPTVGGGYDNVASASYSTIAGGYENNANAARAAIAGGRENTNSGLSAAIGGGDNNTIPSGGQWAAIGGGATNTASGHAATVGGGDNNYSALQGDTVAGGETNSSIGGDSTVGGGNYNLSEQPGDTVAGGQGNQAAGGDSTVGGGYYNDINFLGYAATVPGGANNVAQGAYSFAAGQQADAVFQGDFVWADSQNAMLYSTGPDQFLIRAQGGVGIGTNNPNGATLAVQGSATGGFASPLSLIQNNSSAANASPALRLVGNGDTVNGALSVSAQGTGLIAEFGNASTFVSQLDINGNWTANSFSGDGAGLTNLNLSGDLAISNISPSSGTLAVAGNISANNTPGVNWGQGTSLTIPINATTLIDSCTNAKPAVGYFVIMASAQVNSQATCGYWYLELYDNTTGVMLTEDTVNPPSFVSQYSGSVVQQTYNLSVTWVVPITSAGGEEVFATYISAATCSAGRTAVNTHNLTVMYFPRLNN